MSRFSRRSTWEPSSKRYTMASPVPGCATGWNLPEDTTTGVRGAAWAAWEGPCASGARTSTGKSSLTSVSRSEEHTSELQSRQYLVCRLLLEKKNICLLYAHTSDIHSS